MGELFDLFVDEDPYLCSVSFLNVCCICLCVSFPVLRNLLGIPGLPDLLSQDSLTRSPLQRPASDLPSQQGSAA